MRKLYLALMVIVLAGLVIPGCTQKQPNKAPTAVFVASANAVNVGSQIIFDAANSTDKDGKIVRYHWDFGDMMEDLGVSVVHTFVNGGNCTVTLMVTDNEGSKDKTNLTVHVNEYPKARIDTGLTEVKIFAPVSLSAANSTDSDGTIVKCLWDFGDGTNATGTTVSHPYNDVGAYTVNLTVRDDFGAENSKSVDINVILRCFELSWSIVKHSLSQVSDDSRENTTLNKTISIPQTNMTLVEFQLTWRDDIPQVTITGLKPNDDFKLKVTDPTNNTQSCKDMNENITLNFSLSEAPAVITVRAKDTAGAMAQLSDKYTKTLGKGDWVISVIVGDCGGAQGILPSDLDTGNSWKLDVRYSQYELVVTEK
jgi:PKD repeat protein